jgi:integrase
MSKKRVRKPTITQQIMAVATEKLAKYQHDVTRKMYTRQFKLYIKFCPEYFDCRTFDSCKEHIQEYSNYLQTQNHTASTIHTYLASICAVFDVNLATIIKPIRHTANYMRGRETKNLDSKNDLKNPEWTYIVEFQRRVGIRRDELKRLKGRDFELDESGYPCIVIRKGKGGKCQYQRIFEKDIEFIKSYFDRVNENEYVFDQKYFENDLNFHHLRAEAAKAYYWDQLKRVQDDQTYAEQLEKEIRARWDKTNLTKQGKPRKFKEYELTGIYTLRGKNRELATEKGLPVNYDKRALLATSMFKLAHFRNDVTIASYMLA